MKYLLTLFIIGCTTTADVEKQLGDGANCRSGYDNTFLCTKYNKSYICYPEAHSDRGYVFNTPMPDDFTEYMDTITMTVEV